MIGRAAFDGFSIFKAVVWNTAYFVRHFLAGNNFKPLEPIQWRPAQNLQETNRKQSAIADSTTIVCNFFLCGFVNEDLWTTYRNRNSLSARNYINGRSGNTCCGGCRACIGKSDISTASGGFYDGLQGASRILKGCKFWMTP